MVVYYSKAQIGLINNKNCSCTFINAFMTFLLKIMYIAIIIYNYQYTVKSVYKESYKE